MILILISNLKIKCPIKQYLYNKYSISNSIFLRAVVIFSILNHAEIFKHEYCKRQYRNSNGHVLVKKNTI